MTLVFSHLRATHLLLADMIIDNDPPITRNISVPRDMNQLSCSSFTAGIVEAVLDGLGFVSFVPPPALDCSPWEPAACSSHCAQYANGRFA